MPEGFFIKPPLKIKTHGIHAEKIYFEYMVASY